MATTALIWGSDRQVGPVSAPPGQLTDAGIRIRSSPAHRGTVVE
ncbi:hypothetical protein [Streptomyces sp. NPDC086182]